jgi:hypothetical protein
LYTAASRLTTSGVANYDITRQKMRASPFLTTLYPLWAGIAGKEQVARVAETVPFLAAIRCRSLSANGQAELLNQAKP